MMRATILRGVRVEGRVVLIGRPFPLMGNLFFGAIDRGLNIIQVRVTSLCYLSCPFCSVDAGPRSRRVREFVLDDPSWLAEWLEGVVVYKGGNVDILLDAAGDPLTHPRLPEFVKAVRSVAGVRWVIVETRLHGASEELLKSLAEAGVDRLNVSVDTLNPVKGRILTGSEAYDVRRVLRLAEYAFHELGIDVHVAPLWLPGVNDEDLEEVVTWAIRNGFGRTVPPLGIQKYVVHKRGRKMKEVPEPSWDDWKRFLERLEMRYGVRLMLSMEDYGLRKAPRVPCPVKRGDTVWAIVVCEGPYKREYLGVLEDYSYTLTIVSRKERLEPGDLVLARIFHEKDGIVLAKPE